ncbi:predicted protein [Nematostella vectensis]|uniref:Adenine phosphoribosyltransferase n=1 Tax=Nematostella vectensis TaxID=45351 RepID=A7STC7_NEMVE|nr:predicted protein [Nematostella vectensis]|eukprot:XP_001625135.1 predicted protein [Nematostella vectensis]
MASTPGNVCDQDKAIEHVKSLIRDFPDFPKPGIIFKDICPILKDPNAVRTITEVIAEHIRKNVPNTQAIVGLEARGFLFGPLVALNLNLPFIPVRKAGKLPGKTVQTCYSKEYGKDIFELQEDALTPGQHVVIIDDLIATGGTLVAACELVKQAGCQVKQCVVLVELEDLNGKENVDVPCHVLIKF